MAAQEKSKSPAPAAGAPLEHQPYVPADATMPEFTWQAVVLGSLLGIVFGASSLYLVLKVGLTVSASIPVAVLSITLFRLFSRMFGIRRATILENNIVQTAGSAGESIAFGIGVTMPALLLIGFEMHILRIMVVGVLGGLLGILMMIPLRRAFIVKQHGKLTYPEGTACADVLIVGEQGGASAKTVFAGFGIAFLHKFLYAALHLWKDTPTQPLYWKTDPTPALPAGAVEGLPKAELGGELSPELLGVGYIIGPRIASIMLAGGVLSSLVLVPLIAIFAQKQSGPVPPGSQLVEQMDADALHKQYILYIGAGAVAAGGLISMIQSLPLIIASAGAGLRDMAATRSAASGGRMQVLPRTERDLSLRVVLFGSLLLIVALAAFPSLGLGFSAHGLLGSLLIVFFGFLFVTVSSRLTGEIGSSSNPISGMTVATLLFTCLIFLALEHYKIIARSDTTTLTALSVAAVVCVASSNGGTTSQDLKTGYLVGATPRYQQLAILVGALTSALVIGCTLLVLNDAGTIYSKRPENLPPADVVYPLAEVKELTEMETAGGQYADEDPNPYHVLHVREGDHEDVAPGKYLIDDQGRFHYLVDPAINGRLKTRDDGKVVTNRFDAPKTRLMAIIIDGTLNRKLPWSLVIVGVLIAVTLELAGVPSLPFAVGVYLPISASVPIFLGGLLRWIVDRRKRTSALESESSPGVLLSSGYIAGGTIGGVLIAMFVFSPNSLNKRLGMPLTEWLDLSRPKLHFLSSKWVEGNWPSLTAFGVLMLFLIVVGMGWLLKSDESPPQTSKQR